MILFKATYRDGFTRIINLTKYGGLFENASEMWATAAREAALMYQDKNGVPYPLYNLEFICVVEEVTL